MPTGRIKAASFEKVAQYQTLTDAPESIKHKQGDRYPGAHFTQI